MTMQEKLLSNLAVLIAAFRAARTENPLSEKTISLYATGNSRFFERASVDGNSFTVAKYDEFVEWFADNWPGGAPWPAGVPRPNKTGQTRSKF
jgi:hypothetical protein